MCYSYNMCNAINRRIYFLVCMRKKSRSRYPIENMIPKTISVPTIVSTAGGEWMDAQDVLQMLPISHRTLRRWRARCILNYSKIGKKIFYRRSDIERMLTDHLCHNEKMTTGTK